MTQPDPADIEIGREAAAVVEARREGLIAKGYEVVEMAFDDILKYRGKKGRRPKNLETIRRNALTAAGIVIGSKHEVSGPGGGDIPVSGRLDMSKLSDDQLKALTVTRVEDDPDTG